MIRRVGVVAVALFVPLLTVTPVAAGAPQAPVAPVSIAADPGPDAVPFVDRPLAVEDGPDEPGAAVTRVPARTGARTDEDPTDGVTTDVTTAVTPPVGTVRQWVGLDDVDGTLYRKDYTLRGVGDHIEIWVANDITFPAGDCRNQVASSTVVTDEQVASFVDEFDTNIYPKETAAFSTPPDRDGTNALLGPDANGNGGDYTGGGEKTVTLVDNVRDDNFYTFPAAPTYIAGFFSAQFNELLDRNVMTIDAFDWLHRTGANPPDEPTDDLCTSRPGRPDLYESTFAHEWQHLLQYYTDPFETTWLNEGLSDFAQTLTGYVDANATVFQRGADSHLFCFQGFGTVATDYNTNPRDCGGPENSLTLWDEGGNPNAVLADYGNAYEFMLYLYDHYGTAFMSALHRDGERQGLASLQAQLTSRGVANMWNVVHDYQMMVYLDAIIDGSRCATVSGVNRSRVTSRSVTSTINLANPAINATPGVAPNGVDYVPLTTTDATGAAVALRGRDLKSLEFVGAESLPTLPLAWQIVTDDPDRPGDPVLFSGNANNTDADAVLPVTVPAADPTLTFLAKYGAEAGYDYGYVSVSMDGGLTYTAVAGDHTVDGPAGPGLNGTTVGFQANRYDLSAYAGQDVLLSFRYLSDGGVNEGGLLLDDITLGGTVLSDGSSLAPFSSPTEISPIPVSNWAMKIIGISATGKRTTIKVIAPMVGTELSLGARQLKQLKRFDQVLVMVAYDEPTERYGQYADYTLTVNGVVQPGGSTNP